MVKALRVRSDPRALCHAHRLSRGAGMSPLRLASPPAARSRPGSRKALGHETAVAVSRVIIAMPQGQSVAVSERDPKLDHGARASGRIVLPETTKAGGGCGHGLVAVTRDYRADRTGL